MRLPLLVSLVFATLASDPASAQHADQKALEAAVRALHKDSEVRLIVSPIMVAPNVDGNVKIDGPNREALETHLGAHIEELEVAVRCEDMARPDSCSIIEGGVIYQFFMPEPLQGGVLQLSVMLLIDGQGTGGQIKREWWNLALVRQPDLGWTVAAMEMAETEDGPW